MESEEEMTEKEPFRNAKVGDKVKAPQFFGDKICQITDVRPFGFVNVSPCDPCYTYTRAFSSSGLWEGAIGENVKRALWYVNDKGEMVPDRPKKMVESVVAEGMTVDPCESLRRYESRKSSFTPYLCIDVPVGTKYKIIVEVEE